MGNLITPRPGHYAMDAHPDDAGARHSGALAVIVGFRAAVRHRGRNRRADVPDSGQHPLPRRTAALAELRCIVGFVRLMAQRRLRQPDEHVGMRMRFADGTSSRVYRETVVDGRTAADPCVLVVAFRLRLLRGWGHALFRAESLLNTPLFVGFPGFVSKLWMAHDENGVYRGFYQWDGPDQAERYARSLWRILAIGSVPGSIKYKVLSGLQRDAVLKDPHLLDASEPTSATAWWRPVDVT